jgi:hypothetical protein
MNIRSKLSINGNDIKVFNTPLPDFIDDLIRELSGTPSIENIAEIRFFSGGEQKDSITSFYVDYYYPNTVKLSGSYIPTDTYVLDRVSLLTSSSRGYFYTSLQQPITVVSGNTVSFEWTVTLGFDRVASDGFLDKMSLNMDGLFTALIRLIGTERDGWYPNGVSLKPGKAVVIASDGSTVMAESDNITVTVDNISRRVMYDTGDMIITRTTSSNEYIYEVDFIDTITNTVLERWSVINYEYVGLNDIVRVKFTIQV